MKVFLQETKMSKYQFEQGALGHMLKRPTCCASNLSLGIHGLKDSRTFVDSEEGGVDRRYGRMVFDSPWLMPSMCGRHKRASQWCRRR